MLPDKRIDFEFAIGKRVGMGHFRRCEALAAELIRRGWKCTGRSHGWDGEPNPFENAGVVPGFQIDPPTDFVPRIKVIDSYLLTAKDRRRLVRQGVTVISFLDSPVEDRSQLIVDVNVGADAGAYAAAGCSGRVLAGPNYFPVRPALESLAGPSRAKDRTRSASRLLVTFGGSDWHHLADLTLEELAAAGTEMEIRVAAGDLAGRSERLLAAMRTLPHAELVPPGSELADQFAWADLAVSAAGLTKYELALFGVPAIIVAIAENQVTSAEQFAARTAALYLGEAERLPAGVLAEAIGNLSADAEARAELSQSGRRLVDGRGAARIADAIENLVGE
jgi:spore coat polysaccharide biosynthesis predicted glycosyltransferase SpsG